MNRNSTRAFAFGLLVSAIILFSYQYFFAEQMDKQNSESKQDKVTMEEYTQLEKQAKDWQTKYEELLKKTEETSKEKKEENGKPKTSQYQLHITEGMTSNEISHLLEANHIIQDADEFNEFLANKNVQGYIQIGTYDLNDGMTFEDITSIITNQ